MVFGRPKRAFHSTGGRILALFALCLTLLGAQFLRADDVPSYPSPTFDQAREWYSAAKTNYLHHTENTSAALKFAEACFEWAEFQRDDDKRESLALEGIAAARVAVEKSPKDPGGYYLLAMNKGQLARTKTLGALALVKEMEAAFLKSIHLDPKFDNAAAERSLGMLYLNAPGWPASIGSKNKARKHLERAVASAPDYPTNLLTLIDAYLEWEDQEAVQSATEKYRKLIVKARAIYSGPKWEQSWKDWDGRWKKILEKERDLFGQ
jgi:tetratricopeptide (TPR) repeat protein